MLNDEARRDFDLHTDDVVTLNGNDKDILAVWKNDTTLCAPIVSVSEVKVYEQSLTLSTLKIDYTAGLIGFQQAAIVRPPIRKRTVGQLSVFPRDFQNIQITLTWGYASPPEEISYALACYAASMVTVVGVAGLTRGVRRRRINDFEVEYGSGPYSQALSAWKTSVTSILQNYKTGWRRGA